MNYTELNRKHRNNQSMFKSYIMFLLKSSFVYKIKPAVLRLYSETS